MGREIRMVPPNWEHPEVDHYGRERLQPMHDQNYEDASRKWRDGLAKWEVGERPVGFDAAEYPNGLDYWEYEGGPPDRAYFRPWRDEEATWFQVWETVSEGTPVTPPFATREELIQHLAIFGDAWDQQRGDPPWRLEAALAFVNGPGWAPTGAIIDNVFIESKDFCLSLDSAPVRPPDDENPNEIKGGM